MSARKKEELLAGPRVVGTIHSPGSLRHALRLKAGAIDLLELRVDHFVEDLAPLRKAVGKLAFPYILTVRHPAEGGAGGLALRRRLELYREFLPTAALVDVELRSAKAVVPLLAEARAAGVTVIVSDHHFKRTPPLSVLLRRRAEARRAGAAIVKVAARTETPKDAAVLLELLHQAPCTMSVMGMGPLGKASRLLFARAGSVLNYGYLDQPQVSGQWSALKLAERLREVLTEA